MLTAAIVGLALLGLNAQRRYEGLGNDDSPFADPWQACERMEYGWPATALAVPLSNECTLLPDIAMIGAAFDLAIVGVAAGGLAFLVGRFQRRTF